MNKKFGWVIGAFVLTLLAVGVFGTTTAFADDNGPGRPFGNKGEGPGGRRGFGGRGLDGAGLEAVADVLNMSTDDLSAALKDGQSMQELADEAGVDMQEIMDSLGAVREETMRERIAQAVEDGSMTQEKADWLLEGLDKGFLNGPGFGLGGFHDLRGVAPLKHGGLVRRRHSRPRFHDHLYVKKSATPGGIRGRMGTEASVSAMRAGGTKPSGMQSRGMTM